MINSRTMTEDNLKTCAKCVHLRFKDPFYCCGIDGEPMPDPDLMVLSVCKCFKEVRKWQDTISSNGRAKH